MLPFPISGDHNLNSEDGTEQVFNVSRIIVHGGYNTITNDNDIALVRLSEKATIDDYVNTVCLPEARRILQTGTRCRITGWGATREHGTASNILMEAEVPVVPRNVCTHEQVYGSKITKNMMCAGFQNGGVDSCQGDSGGPFQCRSSGDRSQWVLHGVTSWGRGCGRQLRYGVYAVVKNYLFWIKLVTITSKPKPTVPPIPGSVPPVPPIPGSVRPKPPIPGSHIIPPLPDSTHPEPPLPGSHVKPPLPGSVHPVPPVPESVKPQPPVNPGITSGTAINPPRPVPPIPLIPPRGKISPGPSLPNIPHAATSNSNLGPGHSNSVHSLSSHLHSHHVPLSTGRRPQSVSSWLRMLEQTSGANSVSRTGHHSETASQKQGQSSLKEHSKGAHISSVENEGSKNKQTIDSQIQKLKSKGTVLPDVKPTGSVSENQQGAASAVRRPSGVMKVKPLVKWTILTILFCIMHLTIIS